MGGDGRQGEEGQEGPTGSKEEQKGVDHAYDLRTVSIFSVSMYAANVVISSSSYHCCCYLRPVKTYRTSIWKG